MTETQLDDLMDYFERLINALEAIAHALANRKT